MVKDDGDRGVEVSGRIRLIIYEVKRREEQGVANYS